MKKRENILKKWLTIKIFRKNFFKAITSLIVLSIIVIAVSSYFVFDNRLIGPAFIVLGFINLLFLNFFKIELRSVYPDMVFGLIDNGVLVFAAVLGGQFAGVVGAIIGGAAGNTITDGIGGLFEGHVSESLRTQDIDHKRTSVSAALGKMAGCLFGAGIGLIIVYLISLI